MPVRAKRVPKKSRASKKRDQWVGACAYFATSHKDSLVIASSHSVQATCVSLSLMCVSFGFDLVPRGSPYVLQQGVSCFFFLEASQPNIEFCSLVLTDVDMIRKQNKKKKQSRFRFSMYRKRDQGSLLINQLIRNRTSHRAVTSLFFLTIGNLVFLALHP